MSKLPRRAPVPPSFQKEPAQDHHLFLVFMKGSALVQVIYLFIVDQGGTVQGMYCILSLH